MYTANCAHTYIPTYIHTHKYTYIHTYIHTYILDYVLKGNHDRLLKNAYACPHTLIHTYTSVQIHMPTHAHTQIQDTASCPKVSLTVVPFSLPATFSDANPGGNINMDLQLASAKSAATSVGVGWSKMFTVAAAGLCMYISRVLA